MISRHFVFDTNVLVSAFLFPGSTPQRALENADARGRLLASPATVSELIEVFRRTKFEKYLPLAMRAWMLDGFQNRAKMVSVHSVISDCRDTSDNKFLALALDGHAECIVTGDPHLLELHPWRGVPILTPRAFLDQMLR